MYTRSLSVSPGLVAGTLVSPPGVLSLSRIFVPGFGETCPELLGVSGPGETWPGLSPASVLLVFGLRETLDGYLDFRRSLVVSPGETFPGVSLTVGRLLHCDLRRLDEVNRLRDLSHILSLPAVLRLRPLEEGKQLSMFAVDRLRPSELRRRLLLDCDAH